MRRERRQPTRRELQAATSRRPVVRRIPAPRVSTGRDGPGPRETEQSAGTRNTPERVPGSSDRIAPATGPMGFDSSISEASATDKKGDKCLIR